MPLALAIIGAVVILVGVRNTYGDFSTTLRGEFTGPANFGYRAAAILMIGVIGYAGGKWRDLSVALMALMVIGLMVTVDRGFFTQLGIGVGAAPVTPTAGETGATVTPASGSPGGLLGLPPIPPLPLPAGGSISPVDAFKLLI